MSINEKPPSEETEQGLLGRAMKAARAPYAYNRDAQTATCRACHISGYNLLPEQAGPWHAGHQSRCAGVPGGDRPPGTVLPFRR